MVNSESINTNGEGITQSSVDVGVPPSLMITFGSLAPVTVNLETPPRRKFVGVGNTQARDATVEASPNVTLEASPSATVEASLHYVDGNTQALNATVVVDGNTQSQNATVVVDGNTQARDATVEASLPALPPVNVRPRRIRKRILWTLEEEEMLREGVEASLDDVVKNMSWMRIWEMGSHIFHPTRTPDNLKDKWNRMIRANN